MWPGLSRVNNWLKGLLLLPSYGEHSPGPVTLFSSMPPAWAMEEFYSLSISVASNGLFFLFLSVSVLLLRRSWSLPLPQPGPAFRPAPPQPGSAF